MPCSSLSILSIFKGMHLVLVNGCAQVKLALSHVFPGVQPLDNTGYVKIVLSEQSTKALQKVEDLEVWIVEPTMTRGRKKATDVQPKRAPRKRKRDAEQPKASKKDKVRRETVNAVLASEQQEDAEEELLFTEKSISRAPKGHAAIRKKVSELCSLDARVYEHAPTFGVDGLCRMKMPSAVGVSMKSIIEQSPACFEAMTLCLLHKFCFLFV